LRRSIDDSLIELVPKNSDMAEMRLGGDRLGRVKKEIQILFWSY
jgi:hypothetical protein